MTAFKKSEDQKNYIIRIFEPTGIDKVTILEIPKLGLKQEVRFKGFEVHTLRLNPIETCLHEAGMME